MQEPADTELLRHYAEQNSEAAFGELVTRYVSLVYSAAVRKTGSPDAAEEITQAVFIILARKAKTLRKETILSGWLYQTTRLTAANFLRNEIRRSRREQEASMQSLSNETEAWPEIEPLLEDAMGRLNEKERSAVVQRFFEGRSFLEIGTAFGGSENEAKKRVIRGLEKLRNYFARRGVSSTTAIIGDKISAHSMQAAPAALAKTVLAVAAAKGVASSASTLSLVKGALRIMAWTKAKMAIVMGVAIISATAVTLVAVNEFQHGGEREQLRLPTGNVAPMIRYGYSRNFVVLASDGSLWSWGEERLGWPVLGLSDTNIDHTTKLHRIGNETNWVSVAAGNYGCLAIKSDGTLWGWGGNVTHDLGDGTEKVRPTPVPSVPGNDWKEAATEGGTSYGLKKDGTLWTWGRSPFLDGPDVNVDAVQVGTSTNWTRIWAGGNQAVGLQSDGSLWYWGSLTGDSQRSKDAIRVPTRVPSDTNWTDVFFGYFTVFAIKADGTLWSWGLKANFYTLTPDARSNAIPLQVGTDTDWASCSSAVGCFYHLLQKKDGSLWAIDASEHRIVKADLDYQPIKVGKIDWQKDIEAYAAGGDDIGVILTRDGEVWTWGRAIGQFSKADYRGQDGHISNPKPTVVTKPWQLTNVVTME